MHIHLIVTALALVLLALNLKATFTLARAGCYERKQKVAQFVLIWLVPVAGSILVWTLAAQSYGHDGTPRWNPGQEMSPGTIEHVAWPDSSPGGGADSSS